MKIIRTAAALVAATTTAASAANITIYTDLASYQAAAGPDAFFLDFDGLTGVGVDGDFAGQVDFGTIGATNPDLVNLNGYVGDAGDPSTINNVGILKGELYAPMKAMGFDILSGSIEGVEIYVGGTSLGQALQVASNSFIGIVSDMQFDSFNLLPNVFDATTPVPGGYDRVFIDNFRVSAVPLPPAALLLGASLLGLGFARRKA